MTTIPVSPAITRDAAAIRVAYGVRTPDASQLATALNGGATAFLTNDAGLASLKLIHHQLMFIFPEFKPIHLERLLSQP